MSLELIGALVGVFSVASAVAGAFVRIGKLVQTVKDLTRRVQELEDDADALRLRQRGADA
jgi:outer membrane murein-binding lipoprotein Lpp